MSTAVTTKSPRILARLIRGKSYFLRDKQFLAGKEVEVTADERRHLEEHAVEHKHYPDIDAEQGGEVRHYPRFEFRVE